MRLAILTSGSGSGWHARELCRASSERGHATVVLPYEGLRAQVGRATVPNLQSDDVPLFDMDAVLARIIPGGSLDQIIFRVDALHWLESRGVVVVNSAHAVERCVDKFYTTALLHEAGLPSPTTVVCERASEAMAAVESMGDVVIKPLFGSMGHGLVRVDDRDVAHRVVRTLEQTRTIFYVQRAIDHGGRDIRVFVVGDRVVGAIERTAGPGEWRTNVSRTGRARVCALPPEWEAMARQAAGAVGADYAGVDLLPDRHGQVYVLEVNGIPGWRGLQGVVEEDVAAAIVTHVEARTAGRGASRVARERPA